MRNKKSFQILMVGICIIASFFGLYFQFFHKDGEEKKTEIINEETEGKQEKMEDENIGEYDYADKELPEAINETEDETYTEGSMAEVYFTDTEIIDGSSLPLAAHNKLCESSQAFLKQAGYEDVKELCVTADNFTDNDEMVSFLCLMEGYEEKLKITFHKSESKLKFNIVTIENINKE